MPRAVGGLPRRPDVSAELLSRPMANRAPRDDYRRREPRYTTPRRSRSPPYRDQWRSGPVDQYSRGRSPPRQPDYYRREASPRRYRSPDRSPAPKRLKLGNHSIDSTPPHRPVESRRPSPYRRSPRTAPQRPAESRRSSPYRRPSPPPQKPAESRRPSPYRRPSPPPQKPAESRPFSPYRRSSRSPYRRSTRSPPPEKPVESRRFSPYRRSSPIRFNSRRSPQRPSSPRRNEIRRSSPRPSPPPRRSPSRFSPYRRPSPEPRRPEPRIRQSEPPAKASPLIEDRRDEPRPTPVAPAIPSSPRARPVEVQPPREPARVTNQEKGKYTGDASPFESQRDSSSPRIPSSSYRGRGAASYRGRGGYRRSRSPPRGPRGAQPLNIDSNQPIRNQLPQTPTGPRGNRPKPSYPPIDSRETPTTFSYPDLEKPSTAPMPTVPRYYGPRLDTEWDAEILRLQDRLTLLRRAQPDLLKASRRAVHELEMTSIDLRAAESRRQICSSHLEKAKIGVLGIEYQVAAV